MSMIRYSTTRSLFLTPMLGLLLAACGGDDDAPFNAQGTSEDVQVMAAAFDAPAVQSFGAMGDAMDGAFALPLVRHSSGLVASAVKGPRLMTAGASIARSVRALAGPVGGVSLAVIPEEYLGDTYEYDAVDQRYELSERAGAPANGVRFILYTVNPVTDEPVTPLEEIGYADILDESTATSDAVRLVVVSGDVTYLNYGVAASAGEAEARATINGFVTNGSTQVDFDLDHVASNTEGGDLTLDYELDVPTRDVSLDYLVQLTNAMANANVDLSLAGPHGSVGITGSAASGNGRLVARTNGSDFAYMNFVEGELDTVTKPDGSALTEQEQGVLVGIWALVLQGFDVFEDLVDPIDNLI